MQEPGACKVLGSYVMEVPDNMNANDANCYASFIGMILAWV